MSGMMLSLLAQFHTIYTTQQVRIHLTIAVTMQCQIGQCTSEAPPSPAHTDGTLGLTGTRT